MAAKWSVRKQRSQRPKEPTEIGEIILSPSLGGLRRQSEEQQKSGQINKRNQETRSQKSVAGSQKSVAGLPAVASPGGAREPSALICAHLRLRNSRISFVALLFNFDTWTKSAKTPMNSQKSRLLKVIKEAISGISLRCWALNVEC